MSELPDWEGVPGAPEHRTVGSHRAWCFNDGEWCYPESELMCPCCHGVLGHEEVWFDPKVGPPERAILTDLIAELRGLNQNRDGGMWAEDVHEAADRAEARLRCRASSHSWDPGAARRHAANSCGSWGATMSESDE